MEKIINFENIRYFAYCNDRICKMPVKGIALSFFGLGGSEMYWEETEAGRKFAEDDLLLVVPYVNPWAWMNMQAVNYVDELLDVLIKEYNLPEDIPVVSTGGSMGGLSALVYTRYAKRTPVACVANCPVCDLPYHYTERPDLPRTLYSAFGQYPGTLEEAMQSASPLHLAASMPESAYYIFHCDEDRAVNKEMHSDRFVEALKAHMPVTYHVINGRDHCDLTEEMWKQYHTYIVESVNK